MTFIAERNEVVTQISKEFKDAYRLTLLKGKRTKMTSAEFTDMFTGAQTDFTNVNKIVGDFLNAYINLERADAHGSNLSDIVGDTYDKAKLLLDTSAGLRSGVNLAFYFLMDNVNAQQSEIYPIYDSLITSNDQRKVEPKIKAKMIAGLLTLAEMQSSILIHLFNDQADE